MKKLNFMFFLSAIMIFNIAPGMGGDPIDPDSNSFEQLKAELKQAKKLLKQDKQKLNAQSSSSDGSPTSISDNEESPLHEDLLDELPAISEDEVPDQDFPATKAPSVQIMKRKSGNSKKNSEAQQRLRKKISAQFPCNCTRSEWGVIATVAIAIGAVCYRMGQKNKLKRN